MIKMQSLFDKSRWNVVAAPRPKETPRPGIDALCHNRAWFSIGSMPNPPSKSFLIG
jgi:hypothetical protein